MGFSAVLRDLPRLMRRIGETARTIAAAAPDCLITIDNPDFTLRVAKKVRAANPGIPIIHYICPSVWAWRPGRAAAMKPYVDHVLCILPFEPAELARLGGPPGTFVGHRLTGDPGVLAAAAAQAVPRDLSADREKTLLLLPGSRQGEVSRLIGPFGETVSRPQSAWPQAAAHPADRAACRRPGARRRSRCWEQKPEIVTDAAGKWRAFGEADAALVASGTVSLELALAGVPLDLLLQARPVRARDPAVHHRVVGAAAQPDRRPAGRAGILQRLRAAGDVWRAIVEQLFADTELRAWQKEGFAEVVSAAWRRSGRRARSPRRW